MAIQFPFPANLSSPANTAFACAYTLGCRLPRGLFLGFNQTEHLDAVIGTLAGLAGGFGIGKAAHGSDKHA